MSRGIPAKHVRGGKGLMPAPMQGNGNSAPNAPDGGTAPALWHTGTASRVRRAPIAGWRCHRRADVRCAVGPYVVPVRVGWALGVGLVLCLTVTGCVTMPQTPASELGADAMPEEEGFVAFTAVSAGHEHTCGVRTDGTLACWGWNEYGQAAPPEGTFATVSAGRGHTCGVRMDGTLACWGRNESGQAASPPGTFTAVSVGFRHTCGCGRTALSFAGAVSQ